MSLPDPNEAACAPEAPALVRGRASILSPLRYPGGKRRLVGFVAEALRLNGLRPELFVEPFAGGASVALQLLNDGLVERIALGERDPLVAGFWKTVFHEPEWLVRELRRTPPTLESWLRFRQGRPRTDRGRALACLFLNRTSFSGILHRSAGPIGGRAQASAYGIGCRLATETVVRRIRQAARLADRVAFVRQGAWEDTLRHVESLGYAAGDVFYYLDPPFYEKADRLYRFSFREADHLRLRDRLSGLRAPYLLSYDAAEPVVRLYARDGAGPGRVELLYSATRAGALLKAEELIVSNLPRLPEATRLWRTMAEWRGRR